MHLSALRVEIYLIPLRGNEGEETAIFILQGIHL
jgi:hypothetical protein